jgi:hypothetical protein
MSANGVLCLCGKVLAVCFVVPCVHALSTCCFTTNLCRCWGIHTVRLAVLIPPPRPLSLPLSLSPSPSLSLPLSLSPSRDLVPGGQVECHNGKPYAELCRSCISTPEDPCVVLTQHQLRPLGNVTDAVCGCVKSTCCALGATDLREAAGYRYVPTPIDTSKIRLPMNDKLVRGTPLHDA